MNTKIKPLLIAVDDDCDDLEFYQEAIRNIENAPDLLCFESATEVLNYFKQRTNTPLPPLAIALDINLPGMNGLELLKILKQDPKLKHIPISMVTTTNSPEFKEIALKQGAEHFFTKPLGNTDWEKILKTLVSDIVTA